MDEVRRAEWNARGKSKTKGGRWVKGTRWALLKAPAGHTERQAALLSEVQSVNRRLYRAFLLKEELRALYTDEVLPHRAAEHLDTSPDQDPRRVGRPTTLAGDLPLVRSYGTLYLVDHTGTRQLPNAA